MRRPPGIALLTFAPFVTFAAFAACTPAPATSPTAAPLVSSTASTANATPTSPPPPPAEPAPTSHYDKPPQNILDVLHTPSPPSPFVSPTRDTILLVTRTDYPSIARVAEPYLKLAGVRVEPRNHSRHDTPGGYGITPCATAYDLVKVADGSQIHVPLPAGACAGESIFTADGKQFAFRNSAEDAVELWVGQVATGEVKKIAKVRLNPMLGSTAQWMPDQKTLVVKLVPETLGPPPHGGVGSSQPAIQETNGEKGQSSTYEARDTLKSAHDEALFDHYSASQIALVDAASGSITPIGGAAAYTEVSPAPDGEHLLVSFVHRPYSHLTTVDRFPYDVVVWDRAGKVFHEVAKLPLADRVPVHGVPTGPRAFDWRATEPATLVWAEALDGGDWKAKVPARDKVMLQRAPFDKPAVEIARTEQRFEGFSWGEDPKLALLHENDENRHWTRVFTLNVDDPKAKPKVLWDFSSDERYRHPGSPIFKVLPNGFSVVQEDGNAIYLRGVGSSPEGDRPFLDKLDLAAGKTTRLFRSDHASYEQILTIGDPKAQTFLTWRQSPTDPPNAFQRTLGGASTAQWAVTAVAGEAELASTSRPITHMPDPLPAVRAIKKRLVKYKRRDGVDLSFTLYLPPDYKEGTRVPTILYAYPLDYADASKAGQVTGSEQVFTQLRNYRLLLLAGYAVLDRASFPIVGDPKKAYDTYLEQLVDDAQAAVDTAVKLGVADPNRIGVTGHSHGALMTANLMAHSSLFRAGVATSGSYNKTLTPFGFQNERRSVWEAQSVYLKASPFFFADKLTLPLLIMHGQDDANPGTTPLQAEKLYEAIRGNGGTARLVMLPHEPHWYAAMESNEQLLFEMVRWFDCYVKDAGPRGEAHPAPPVPAAHP